MAIEKEPSNIDQDGSIDIEILDALAGQPQDPMGMEVQLPEEKNAIAKLIFALNFL